MVSAGQLSSREAGMPKWHDLFDANKRKSGASTIAPLSDANSEVSDEDLSEFLRCEDVSYEGDDSYADMSLGLEEGTGSAHKVKRSSFRRRSGSLPRPPPTDAFGDIALVEFISGKEEEEHDASAHPEAALPSGTGVAWEYPLTQKEKVGRVMQHFAFERDIANRTLQVADGMSDALRQQLEQDVGERAGLEDKVTRLSEENEELNRSNSALLVELDHTRHQKDELWRRVSNRDFSTHAIDRDQRRGGSKVLCDALVAVFGGRRRLQ